MSISHFAGNRAGWRADGGAVAAAALCSAFASAAADAGMNGPWSMMILQSRTFVALVIAGLMPNYVLFGLALILVGWSAQTFNTTANSITQLWTEPAMRGIPMGRPCDAPELGGHTR